MFFDKLSFRCAVLVVLVGCGSGTPAHEPAANALAETQASPAPPPPVQELPERSCDQLLQDAYAVVSSHNGCTADAECGMAAAACPGGFACGLAVRASDVAQVNAEVAPISERYKAQCKQCAKDRVRCMKPNPVCSDGRCMHVAPRADCDRLEQEAEALIQKHDGCASDVDCVFARDGGGCPMAFGCGTVVNKAQEQAFVALAKPLSDTFYKHCGTCTAMVAECSAATPICDKGHCSRRRTP